MKRYRRWKVIEKGKVQNNVEKKNEKKEDNWAG